MNEHDLKTGDTVRLKSGSPDMTVLLIDPPNANNTQTTAFCGWFVDCKYKQAAFPVGAVSKV